MWLLGVTFFTGMVLMDAVTLQVAFLFHRDSQWALKNKLLSVRRIQPQNVFDEVTTEELPLPLKFHQKFWLWPSLLFSSYKQLCSFILQRQATAGFLHCGGGSKCAGCMPQSTESLRPHLLPHVCSKRVRFNNPLLCWWCQFKKQARSQAQLLRPVLFLFPSTPLTQLLVGPFPEGGELQGRKRFHLGHFLDLVFTNNCISPPKKVTNYRLATQMNSSGRKGKKPDQFCHQRLRVVTPSHQWIALSQLTLSGRVLSLLLQAP